MWGTGTFGAGSPRGGAGPFDYTKLAVDQTDRPHRGRLHASSSQADRIENGENIWPLALFRSTDSGRSFRGPVHVQPNNFNNQNGDRDSYLAHSDDAGATWSDPRRFAARDSGAHVTAVMVTVDELGVVGLAWQAPRLDAGEGCFEFRFAVSGDGGESFTGPVPVSSAVGCAPDPDAIPGLTRRWPSGGDYFGLVAVPGGGFRALWSDARTGVYQLWTAPVEVQVR